MRIIKILSNRDIQHEKKKKKEGISSLVGGKHQFYRKERR